MTSSRSSLITVKVNGLAVCSETRVLPIAKARAFGRIRSGVFYRRGASLTLRAS